MKILCTRYQFYIYIYTLWSHSSFSSLSLVWKPYRLFQYFLLSSEMKRQHALDRKTVNKGFLLFFTEADKTAITF